MTKREIIKVLDSPKADPFKLWKNQVEALRLE